MMQRALAILALVLASTPGLPAEAPNAEARFTISEFRVLGNSKLETRDVERAVYPFLGEGKNFQDVEQARQALQGVYQNRGYGTVFVDIPEQTVDSGIVRLKVTEGTLARTRLTGARYFSDRQIRAALPAATENTVPHLPTLQAELTALNAQTSDRSVVPVLQAGSEPGTINLALNVHDELPLHGSLELNNQYTTDTTQLRSIAALSYDNLFGRLDSLALQYQTAPQRLEDATVWAISYTRRVTDSGNKLAFFFVDSDSNVATAGNGGTAINVIGTGKIYGSRLIVPLTATAAASHVFIGGLEYKDFTESVFTKDLLLTPISYANLSLGHQSAWRGQRSQWGLASNIAVGLRGQLNDEQEFENKRFRAKPNYFFLHSEGSIGTALPWHLAVRARVSGQYAVDPIISNEQFSIAGADGVRGYREAELLGDVAIKGSFEFGTQPVSWFVDRLQGNTFLFFDYGRMTRLNPLRDENPTSKHFGELLEQPNQMLRSAGAGFGFSAWDHLQGQVVWAYPLADVEGRGGTQAGDSRLHFSVISNW